MKSIVFVFSILIAGLVPLSLDEAAPFRSFSHAFAASAPSQTPLITTDQEVRQFFDQYIERYNQLDADGFVRLFSMKAKQNQWDGLQEIRSLYSDYFNEMISLQNSLEEMKIEIYQNAAEVRARYSVNQVLKKGGEKRVLQGSGRWVLIKEDGMLKILSFDYRNERTP